MIATQEAGVRVAITRSAVVSPVEAQEIAGTAATSTAGNVSSSTHKGRCTPKTYVMEKNICVMCEVLCETFLLFWLVFLYPMKEMF